MHNLHPTPYKDINEILNLLLTSTQKILKDQFVGMYLYGSLSSGDFNPKSSDIDFLVITKDILPETTISKLESMHHHIWEIRSKWPSKLEGSYVHRDLIRKHDPDGAPCPTVNEGNFFVGQRGSDWIIQRHIIRECGVVLDGPDPKTLIDFVGSNDIRNAVLGILREWWFPMLDNPTWLRDKEAGDRAFAVITMCRVLHALEHGTIISKPKAIQWTSSQLNEPWNQIINKAVAVSNHEKQDVFVDDALRFIQYVKEKAQ